MLDVNDAGTASESDIMKTENEDKHMSGKQLGRDGETDPRVTIVRKRDKNQQAKIRKRKDVRDA